MDGGCRWLLYASGRWDRFHCRVNRSLASAHCRLHTEQYTQCSQGLIDCICALRVRTSDNFTYYARNYAYANRYLLCLQLSSIMCASLLVPMQAIFCRGGKNGLVQCWRMRNIFRKISVKYAGLRKVKSPERVS